MATRNKLLPSTISRSVIINKISLEIIFLFRSLDLPLGEKVGPEYLNKDPTEEFSTRDIDFEPSRGGSLSDWKKLFKRCLI